MSIHSGRNIRRKDFQGGKINTDVRLLRGQVKGRPQHMTGFDYKELIIVDLSQSSFHGKGCGGGGAGSRIKLC